MDLNILPKEIKLSEKTQENSKPAAIRKTESAESSTKSRDSVKKEGGESKISDFQKKIEELMQDEKTKISSKEMPDETGADEINPDETETNAEEDTINANIALNNFIDISKIPDSDSKIISITAESNIPITEESAIADELAEKSKTPVGLDLSKIDKASQSKTIDNDMLATTVKTDIPGKLTESAKPGVTQESKEAKSPEKSTDKINSNEKEGKTDTKFFDSLLKDNKKVDTKNLSEFANNNGRENPDTEKSEKTTLKVSEGNNNIPKGNEFSFQPTGKIETRNSILSMDKTSIYNAVSKQMEDSVNAVLSSNRKEIKIDMSPPGLGSIKIEVITHKNKEVTISIFAKDVDVKSLIDTNKNELLSNMSDKGILVKEFSVSVGGNKNWDQKWRENFKKNSDKRVQSIDSTVETDNAVSSNDKKASISFDGKVDVYV